MGVDTKYGEGVATKPKGWGASEVSPIRKGGAEKVLGSGN